MSPEIFFYDMVRYDTKVDRLQSMAAGSLHAGAWERHDVRDTGGYRVHGPVPDPPRSQLPRARGALCATLAPLLCSDATATGFRSGALERVRLGQVAGWARRARAPREEVRGGADYGGKPLSMRAVLLQPFCTVHCCETRLFCYLVVQHHRWFQEHNIGIGDSNQESLVVEFLALPARRAKDLGCTTSAPGRTLSAACMRAVGVPCPSAHEAR
mmetsp:Transcript_97412/g.261789  ORF Transcript_97412/g.261789 Transcript_97412/m.261789 type:complete len:213 (+) Transcript_97412:3-641(+)